ncbi:uncharacterized protein LOC108669321 [Hyalella azteca]|uniref:Uncharacterized protein LOC108669321 n=1 Tax=Hyalella azteca TaxID=294128 RepID=A0A8B7NES6_HYAAZ|nr:uncharacterized protein LOC108669321 [Hyalella azteca]
MESCDHSITILSMREQYEAIINKLDDDLKAFFFKQIHPLFQYMESGGYTNFEKLMPIAHFICEKTLSLKDSEAEQCEEDFLSLTTKVLGENFNSDFFQDQSKRFKRFVDYIEDPANALERSSYSGYEEKSNNGYEEPSPSYILVPDDEYDYAYPFLVKFLAAAAIGTYGFLGLLAFQTLLFLLVNRSGPPGEKGNKGLKGINGVLGDKGMKGFKGMTGDKGLKGPSGSQGMQGMEGDTGPDGDGGDMGPTGPKGFKGPKGMKGVKAQKGVKGPKGPLGDKGNKGLKGFKGFKGDINPGKGNGRRRRRSVTVRYQKSRSDGDLVNLLDAPLLLDSLFRQQVTKNVSTEMHDESISDIYDVINRLWRQYKSPVGCARCLLFELLKSRRAAILDNYVIAGFTHVLGDSGSLQLLDDVRRGRQRGVKMRCRRQKNSCFLEYLSSVQQ